MPLNQLTASRPYGTETQEDIQRLLRREEEERGLSAALERLFTWSLEAGYFREGIFDGNDLFSFPDPATPYVLRTQINRARVGYQAPSQERPGCPICFDQVASEAKPLLRAYEFPLGRAAVPFFAQLTPFPLRRRHYIVIQKEHAPMRVGEQSVDELLDFVERAPNFTACSNSDVRNAGVSILDHHHYQVFADFELPVMQALPAGGLEEALPGGRLALLDYPLTALRVRGGRAFVTRAASAVLAGWKSRAPGRNTCNLTARRAGADFELHLFFRNPAHLTPPDLLRIKSEGVGVVEASGEAIYPPPDDAVLEEIRTNGRVIFRRILEGLNPLAPEERPAFFEEIRKWVRGDWRKD